MPNAANPSKASRHRRLRALAQRSLIKSCTVTVSVAALTAAALGAIASPAVAAPVAAAPIAAAAAFAAAGDAVGTAPSAPWAKAFAQGQWTVAVGLLETIPESSRTASHWLHLARALERSAQLVEAFAAYERVHDLAAEAGAPLRDVERQAKSESSALASRIPWAEVSLARALPIGALVFVDQQWLEPARLRSPYPVNPGWHTFLVESNGEVLAARRAFFEEGQTRLVPLTALHITEGDDDASVLAANGASALERPSGSSRAESRSLSPSRSLTASQALSWHPDDRPRPDADRGVTHDAAGLLRASYVTLGVGALGTLVGTGFLISALNTRSTIGDYSNCFSRCDADARADAEQANRSWRARTTAATASYAVGLTGLVAGGVLWLLHRDSSARAATVNIADLSLELAPRFSPHGAMLRGTF